MWTTKQTTLLLRKVVHILVISTFATLYSNWKASDAVTKNCRNIAEMSKAVRYFVQVNFLKLQMYVRLACGLVLTCFLWCMYTYSSVKQLSQEKIIWPDTSKWSTEPLKIQDANTAIKSMLFSLIYFNSVFTKNMNCSKNHIHVSKNSSTNSYLLDRLSRRDAVQRHMTTCPRNPDKGQIQGFLVPHNSSWEREHWAFGSLCQFQCHKSSAPPPPFSCDVFHTFIITNVIWDYFCFFCDYSVK